MASYKGPTAPTWAPLRAKGTLSKGEWTFRHKSILPKGDLRVALSGLDDADAWPARVSPSKDVLVQDLRRTHVRAVRILARMPDSRIAHCMLYCPLNVPVTQDSYYGIRAVEEAEKAEEKAAEAFRRAEAEEEEARRRFLGLDD